MLAFPSTDWRSPTSRNERLAKQRSSPPRITRVVASGWPGPLRRFGRRWWRSSVEPRTDNSSVRRRAAGLGQNRNGFAVPRSSSCPTPAAATRPIQVSWTSSSGTGASSDGSIVWRSAGPGVGFLATAADRVCPFHLLSRRGSMERAKARPAQEVPVMLDVPFRPAKQLAADIRKKTIGCLELLDLYLARVEKYDGMLNAVVVRDFDRARTRARAADRALSKRKAWGQLHGVPMTIKESYDAAG